MNHVCNECHQPIPAGLAVLRSISFERLAFHGHCWDLRQATAEPAVSLPVQRRGGTLTERLELAAAARAS